jgi:imidazolonepropionase-like amidohydrolase
MKAILLRNGIIYDVDSDKEIKRDILIKDGKIAEVAENIVFEEEELTTIDLQEQFVSTGFIDCHTHIGIIEEGSGKIGVDNNECSDPVTAQLNSINAINPFDISFIDAVKSGVTCVMSGPGSNNVVGGQNIVIKTHGMIIDQMVVKNPAGFKIALGENPLSTYGVDKKCPVTRMAVAALIRELFMRTEDYIVRKEKGNIDERDIKLEAVIPVIKGQIPLRAHAHRADDIATAIRIADEFKIKKLVIEHGTEAHLIKEYLKEKNIPVAVGPMLSPRIKMEMKARSYHTICELAELGIKTAIITDHPYNSIDKLRAITAIAMSEGLSYKDAVKALTVNPSEILECEDRIGKLKPGYDADIVVYNGNPLNISSKVQLTIIEGKIVYSAEK